MDSNWITAGRRRYFYSAHKFKSQATNYIIELQLILLTISPVKLKYCLNGWHGKESFQVPSRISSTVLELFIRRLVCTTILYRYKNRLTRSD